MKKSELVDQWLSVHDKLNAATAAYRNLTPGIVDDVGEEFLEAAAEYVIAAVQKYLEVERLMEAEPASVKSALALIRELSKSMGEEDEDK